MSDLGLLAAQVNSLPQEMRPTMLRIITELVKNTRFGHPADMTASTNFGAAFYEATTPSTPGDEFTISHGLGRTPYLLVPVLPLDVEGAQLVPLVVTRVADDNRVYLASSVADAPFTCFIEG